MLRCVSSAAAQPLRVSTTSTAFAASACATLPTSYEPSRNMATLADIKTRLAAVKNMKKITSAMKMVAASKLRGAENALHPAKAYGATANRLTEGLEIDYTGTKKHLIVAVTTDRGLCGGVNSSILKAVRVLVEDAEKDGGEIKLVTLGEKGRAGLARDYASNFLYAFSDFGRTPFNYTQASYIADKIVNCDYDYDKLSLVSNRYVSVVSYKQLVCHTVSPSDLAERRTSELQSYELEGDPDIINNYSHQYLANMIYQAYVENFAVEQAARMNAMDSASTNASDMIGSLELMYNRTRQAVITRELIEIVSGASALDG